MDIEKKSIDPQEENNNPEQRDPAQVPAEPELPDAISSEDAALEGAEATALDLEDSFEHEDALFDEDLEGSTIFTKSPTAEEKPKSLLSAGSKRQRLFILLIAVALVAAVAIFGIIKLLPKEEETDPFEVFTLKVKVVSAYDIEKIVVNNNYGRLVLLSTLNETSSTDSSDSSPNAVWSLEGYDENLIASSAVNAAADSIASLYAVREMTDLTLDYGLDRPTITATVTLRTGETYTVTIGDIAPDKTGYYVQVSGDEKVYLVAAGTINNFDTTPEKLANAVIISTPKLDDSTKTADKKYYNDSNELSTFDSIELSGPKYGGQTVTLLPIADHDFAKYEIKIGNESRYADADKVQDMFGLLTNGLVAIDTYQLEPTDAHIASYGLNNPDAIIRVNCGSYSVTLRAKMYDTENNYYAVMIDGRNGIYAVTAPALAMLDHTIIDFYHQYIFLEYLRDFSNMTVQTAGKTYSFDIAYDESEKEVTATMGGKEIDAKLLSAYYQYYSGLSPQAQSEYTEGSVDLTATFTYRDTTKGRHVIQLIQQSDRRYLVVLDGQKMGLINSTVFRHLSEYAQYVVDGQGIPSLN